MTRSALCMQNDFQKSLQDIFFNFQFSEHLNVPPDRSYNFYTKFSEYYIQYLNLVDSVIDKIITYKPSRKLFKDSIQNIIFDVLRNPDIIDLLYKMKTYDDNTFRHSFNVCIISICIAKSMSSRYNFNDNNIKILATGSLLHDIGKIKIPKSILNKQDKLDSEEYDEIKKHPVYGSKILKAYESLDKKVTDIVMFHHKRYDGLGYPENITLDKTKDLINICSVADVYDAITSDRPYRKAYTHREAIKYLADNSNTAFDPKTINYFTEYLAI